MHHRFHNMDRKSHGSIESGVSPPIRNLRPSSCISGVLRCGRVAHPRSRRVRAEEQTLKTMNGSAPARSYARSALPRMQADRKPGCPVPALSLPKGPSHLGTCDTRVEQDSILTGIPQSRSAAAAKIISASVQKFCRLFRRFLHTRIRRTLHPVGQCAQSFQSAPELENRRILKLTPSVTRVLSIKWLKITGRRGGCRGEGINRHQTRESCARTRPQVDCSLGRNPHPGKTQGRSIQKGLGSQ